MTLQKAAAPAPTLASPQPESSPATALAGTAPPSSLVALREGLGNRAFGALLEAQHAAGRSLVALRDALGNRAFGALLQAQLTVGRSDDPYEHEADRVADHVMRMSDPAGAAPASSPSPDPGHAVRRQMDEEGVEVEEEEEELEGDEDADVAAVGGSDIQIQRQPEDEDGADLPEPEDEDETDVQLEREPSAGPPPVATGTASRVHSLRGMGDPLTPSLRGYFEPRFGRDLGAVRTHTGTTADDTARALGARAYTFGTDIAFRHGAFSPGSDEGRRLLAHELTHVIQQTSGRATHALQRKRRKLPAQKRKEIKFPFKVNITSPLTEDQLLLAFVKQYRRLGTDAEAKVILQKQHWHWIDKVEVPTQKDIDKGYKLVWVHTTAFQRATSGDTEQEYMKRLPEAERGKMNAEVDRQFWARTNYTPDQQLGSAADDEKFKQAWLDIRDELVQQRQALDNLSPLVKAALFREGAPVLEPKDYAKALRIAERLSLFSAAELADYKSKINTVTTDWDVYEDSLKRYLVERDIREESLRERETIKTKLFGLDELYAKYRQYRRLERGEMLATVAAVGGGASLRLLAIQEKERIVADLNRDLPRYGFKDIAEFETYIHKYELAFQKETAAIAFDLLAQYEHVLYEEEKRYQDPANVTALHQSISGTQAKKHYEEAREHRAVARSITPDPELHRFLPGEWEWKQRETKAAEAAESAAESEFAGATAGHPLLEKRDFPRERLTRAAPEPGEDARKFQSILLDYIHDRREDVRKTHAHLTVHPERVFKLDDLLKVSYEVQKIEPGSIFDLIVQDKIGDDAITDAIWSIVVAVFAIILGILSFGTGTVAVLAAIGAFGISAYQALKEYEEYEIKSAEYGAELLSKQPSFAWVIVAVVGAGLDLAAAGSALKAMRTAVTTFNEAGAAGDLAKLEADLKALGEVSDQMRANTLRAARAELQYRQAVQGLAATTGRLSAVVIPVDEIRKLVGVAYYLAKRGIIAFDKFLLELKAQKLLKSIEALSGEELAVLKQAFQEGIKLSETGFVKYEKLSDGARKAYAAAEVEDVASQGAVLGYTDKEVGDFLEAGSAVRPSSPPPPLPPRTVPPSSEPLVWVNTGAGRGRGVYHPQGTKWFNQRTKEGVEMPLSWAEAFGFRRAGTKRAIPAIEPRVVNGRQAESLGSAPGKGPKFISSTARKPRAVRSTSIRPDITEAHGHNLLIDQGELGLQRPLGSNVRGVDSITVRVEFDAAGKPLAGKTKIYLNDMTTPTVTKGAKPSHAKWRAELDDALGLDRLKFNDPAVEAAIRQAAVDGEVYVRVVRVDFSPAGQGAVTIAPGEITRLAVPAP